jgi:hypothetical protein
VLTGGIDLMIHCNLSIRSVALVHTRLRRNRDQKIRNGYYASKVLVLVIVYYHGHVQTNKQLDGSYVCREICNYATKGVR